MNLGRSLGRVAPDAFVDARLQLHAAAQMVAWVGRRVLPPADGPIRAALFWDERSGGMLVGAQIAGPSPDGAIRVALGFYPAAILLLEGEGQAVRDRFELHGSTFPDLWARLTSALAKAGVDTGRLAPPPSDQLPTDELRAGSRLQVDPTGAAELGRWFGTAAGLLSEQAASRGSDPAVPCWSHHFDMAVVVPLPRADDARPDPDHQPQVTLGFSPGDDTIPEPYLYVLAWPLAADLAGLPEPPHPGRWQRDGWTGLALPGSILLAAGDAGDPSSVGRSFLNRGFEVARDLALAA